jgi:hypothetical protein
MSFWVSVETHQQCVDTDQGHEQDLQIQSSGLEVPSAMP